MSIELENSKLDEFQNQIEGLESAIVQIVAERILAQIMASWSAQSPSPRGNAPAIVSGDLAESVTIQTDGKTKRQVGSDLDYGRWLEFGTSQLIARPWLRPAAEAVRQDLLVIIRELFSNRGINQEENKNAGT